MSYANIDEYNKYLVDNSIEISLIDYFNNVHELFYEHIIDISFMDYFLEISKFENDFIIDHYKLKEFDIIQNIKTNTEIKCLIQKFKLIENIDYIIIFIDKLIGNFIKRLQLYKFTPTVFKLCLLCPIKTKKYAKYYILLELIVKYYSNYLIDLKSIQNPSIPNPEIPNPNLNNEIPNPDISNNEISPTIMMKAAFIDNDKYSIINKLEKIIKQNNELKEENKLLSNKLNKIYKRVNLIANKLDIEIPINSLD